MRSAARNWRPSGACLRGVTGAVSDAATVLLYSPSRWRPPFTKASILPEWRAFFGVGFAVFLTGVKMPLIGDYRAAAVVTALYYEWRVMVTSAEQLDVTPYK